MIKLFRTYDSGVINSCMSFFCLPTVSKLIDKRKVRFFYRNVGLISGELIVQGLPVAVMWSIAVGMWAYNATRAFLFLSVCVGVLFVIFQCCYRMLFR